MSATYVIIEILILGLIKEIKKSSKSGFNVVSECSISDSHKTNSKKGLQNWGFDWTFKKRIFIMFDWVSKSIIHSSVVSSKVGLKSYSLLIFWYKSSGLWYNWDSWYKICLNSFWPSSMLFPSLFGEEFIFWIEASL